MGPASQTVGKTAQAADPAAWAEVDGQRMGTSVVDQDDVLRVSFAAVQEVHSLEQHRDLGLLARKHRHNHRHARLGERTVLLRHDPAVRMPKGVRKGYDTSQSHLIVLFHEPVRKQCQQV